MYQNLKIQCVFPAGPSTGKKNKKETLSKQTSVNAVPGDNALCVNRSVIDGCACMENCNMCSCKETNNACRAADPSKSAVLCPCQCNKCPSESSCRKTESNGGIENLCLFGSAFLDSCQNKAGAQEHSFQKSEKVVHGSDKSNDKKSFASCSLTSSFDICAIADGENAMFPDAIDKLRQSGKECEEHSDSVSPGSNKGQNESFELAEGDVQEMGDNSSTKPVKSSQEEMEKVFKNMLDIGWTSNDGADITIAELYLMFGVNGELKFEYDWISLKKESELAQERLLMSLNNMLRRLSHLATLEITEFSKVFCTCVIFICFAVSI